MGSSRMVAGAALASLVVLLGCAGGAQTSVDGWVPTADRTVTPVPGVDGGGGGAVALDGWVVGDNPKKIRVVYLVPQDEQENPAYTAALERAIKHVQLWFFDKMGDGTTFSLAPSPVQVIRTNHPTSYYTAPADPTTHDEFGIRARLEGEALVGSSPQDPDNGWLFIIDADRPCEHGEGGLEHATIISAALLQQLLEEPLGGCDDGRYMPGRCRAYGRLAWWIAYFGGARADETCAKDGECRAEILMEQGRGAYPDTDLLAHHKQALKDSGFFAAHAPGAAALWPCP